MELDTVLSDLEGVGYSCRPFVIPACAVDAPHRRMRVWIVGHSDGGRRQQRHEGQRGVPEPDQRGKDVADSDQSRMEGCPQTGDLGSEQPDGDQQPRGRGGFCSWPDESQWFAESGMGRVAHGVSSRVARLKALGNAIVPQLAYEILREIRNLV